MKRIGCRLCYCRFSKIATQLLYVAFIFVCAPIFGETGDAVGNLQQAKSLSS